MILGDWVVVVVEVVGLVVKRNQYWMERERGGGLLYTSISHSSNMRALK